MAVVTRRNLPHWYMPGAAHFVTFRLANTLPRSVLDDLQRRRQTLLDEAPVGESEDARSPLAEIMHSLKSYTAHEANKLLGRSGQFWQHESYDHWVRDDDELERVVAYINANPVAAGLVARAEDWYW